jgi:rhodanese-related sulfurtransferase
MSGRRGFEAGHIPGAVNLDINGPDFQERAAKLDKSKTYLVHCAAGGRSARACNAMDKLSFTNLVNLEPGFNAWKKAGKPVEQK